MIGVEISFEDQKNFLKIRETLTRIGIPDSDNKSLTQTCFILHKRGKMYICHFKEMFLIDGKETTLSSFDYGRRDLIVKLLTKWGLCETNQELNPAPMNSVKIIPFSEKEKWVLKQKYAIGKRRKHNIN